MSLFASSRLLTAAVAFAGALLAAPADSSVRSSDDPSLYPAVPAGALEFEWAIGGEPVRLRSEPWFAGAVSSLTFRGVEFLNAADHGRLLQGAISFERSLECLNPTQAGASRDRPPKTTSRLLWVRVRPDSYGTATHMAYWKRPGEHCGGARRALNRTALSDTVYTQVLRPGFRGHANAVAHDITFSTGSDRAGAVVEALTAYTPPQFDTFHVYRPDTGRFVVDRTVQRQPGEQPGPVILSTADGSSALGFLALTDEPRPGYGRFTFGVTNKINVVFRPDGVYRAGSHTYRCVWAIGTLTEVQETIRSLATSERRGRRA
ncbi:MAG TPA: hypothetical protein VF699_10705 [Caulobacteraceae bacterium]|jgi:hypothetical protein